MDRDQLELLLEGSAFWLLFLGALVLPWLGLGWIARRMRERSTRVRGLALTGSFMFALLTSASGLLFATCGFPGEPGHGAKARIGFRRAEPVIAAVERYRQTAGRLPDSLQQLIPGFLEESRVTVVQRRLGGPLEYSRRGSDSYELMFRYGGPGMNQCEYASQAKNWRCWGYF